MDGAILAVAETLLDKLMKIDPAVDRDTLVWAHGFLSGIVKGIEVQIPELMATKTLLQSVEERLKGLSAGSGPDDPEGLERIRTDPAGPEAPVPARPRKGPTGRGGGIALSLPDPGEPL